MRIPRTECVDNLIRVNFRTRELEFHHFPLFPSSFITPLILERAISMVIKQKSSRKRQLPSLQENLNITKTVNFTKTFTYKRMLGISVPTENTRHFTRSAGELVRPKKIKTAKI